MDAWEEIRPDGEFLDKNWLESPPTRNDGKAGSADNVCPGCMDPR